MIGYVHESALPSSHGPLLKPRQLPRNRSALPQRRRADQQQVRLPNAAQCNEASVVEKRGPSGVCIRHPQRYGPRALNLSCPLGKTSARESDPVEPTGWHASGKGGVGPCPCGGRGTLVFPYHTLYEVPLVFSSLWDSGKSDGGKGRVIGKAGGPIPSGGRPRVGLSGMGRAAAVAVMREDGREWLLFRSISGVKDSSNNKFTSLSNGSESIALNASMRICVP